MDVVPIRGLQGSFNIDAFISSDMSTICVDEFVLENRLNRYPRWYSIVMGVWAGSTT
jgi:hypothetical protein